MYEITSLLLRIGENLSVSESALSPPASLFIYHIGLISYSESYAQVNIPSLSSAEEKEEDSDGGGGVFTT